MAENSEGARRLGPVARMLGAAAARVWSLPAPRNAVTVTRGIRIPVCDGVTLLADHYAPASPSSSSPTVLVRTPYGRSLPASLADAQLVAGHGYHVLLVSCRGTFGSGGEFDPGRHEAADGQACVAWLREQEWFDGRLGTVGLSYLGFTQWALATDPPLELRAVAVQAGLHDFARSVYHNGAFSLYTTVAWADAVTHQEEASGLRGLALLATADRRERRAMGRNPIGTHVRAMLGGGAPWFEKWLATPDIADPYWEPLRCGAALERLTAPVLLIGGWQDIFLRQTVEQYRALSGRGVPVRLVIGPWTHLQIATKGGGVAMRETLAWLDRHLSADDVPDAPSGQSGPDNHEDQDASGGTRDARTVRAWFGGEGWRDLPDWPPPAARTERWSLLPGGGLGAPGTSGEPGNPAEAKAPGETDSEMTFRYDPALPTPSVGGAVLTRAAGVRDNRAVERRPDVLVFTSAPLTAPVVVAGEAVAEVSVSRDNPCADVFARLCDVDPGGRSRNVCDGIVRLSGADPLETVVRVVMAGAAHRFAAGHRLRVQVSGGAHPRFARNPGTGGVDAPAADLRDTRYRVRVGPAAGSALLLPVLPADT
ncbi:MAG: CocE/NonD family hydrolase [Nocardiopsaceae bacterium]|nr:CocE/NonD family hydrolase [Nocardiopsaceae bacterium]